MAGFMIRFLIGNIFISGIIGILLIVKRIFKNSLSNRMQYNLWFLLLVLLTVPFIPFRLLGFPQITSWLASVIDVSTNNTETAMGDVGKINLPSNTNWMNDYTLSVNSEGSFLVGHLLLGIWILGILVMTIFVIKSYLRLCELKKSALPLQNQEVGKLYHHCLKEMKISKKLPVYSTAFLKSPIIVGVLKPCIYLPIHLISDYCKSDMRYILLHELQHYKHRDAIASQLMNLFRVVYWFNPFVWYALQVMRNDREIACDTSVLMMLNENDYEEYGNTLINFAERVSLAPFSFVACLSGNMKQMKRRIINIASYKKPTLRKKIKSIMAFMLTATLLFVLAPFASTYAEDENHYQWNFSSKKISYINLHTYFNEYEGSFVLYDLANDTWSIHDMEHATLRVAPNSTYKIYDALFGLEAGVITPEDSFLVWNGENYPFEAWNADQTLQSAMNSSVNWYFQTIDEQLGISNLSDYLHEIGYGNENLSGDLASYWMESTLEISPIEQVELLTKLQQNRFGFSSENIDAVKDSICLSTSDIGTFYGKTGTGRVNGQDVNGWFVGMIETANNTYFFSTNIGSNSTATGSKATEITLSILSDMNIWN